jgi:hypothetical protein
VTGRRSLFCTTALTHGPRDQRGECSPKQSRSPRSTLSSYGRELPSPYGSALVSSRRQGSFSQSGTTATVEIEHRARTEQVLSYNLRYDRRLQVDQLTCALTGSQSWSSCSRRTAATTSMGRRRSTSSSRGGEHLGAGPSLQRNANARSSSRAASLKSFNGSMP